MESAHSPESSAQTGHVPDQETGSYAVDETCGTATPKSLRFFPIDTVHFTNSPGADDDVSERSASQSAQVTEGLVTNQQEPRPNHKPRRKKRKKRRHKRTFKDIRIPADIVLCGRLRLSRWILISLILLFSSTVIFLVSFVTNNWGLLRVREPEIPWTDDKVNWTSLVRPTSMPATTKLIEQFAGQPHGEKGDDEEWDDVWHFGLWQCCRVSDGLCLGTRWPWFYSVTRAFCVLALFGHCLSLAWLIGNTIEQLLDYDVCTLATLTALCFTSASFVLVAVACFGARWTADFQNEKFGTHPVLSYSFYLSCVSVPLTLLSGIFILVDLRASFLDLESDSVPRRDDEVVIIGENTSEIPGRDVTDYGTGFATDKGSADFALESVVISGK